ncbi:MAG TPA: DUF192 domain-containing protein [Bryobacteraceae bacterium]|nr:DUF192 domain-containing protein [Bryobacteraceae bacterium]
MRNPWLGCLLGCLLLPAAGCGPKTVGLDEFEKKEITLPGGQIVRAEVMIKAFDMQRGMMFRDALPRGQGMLFVHEKSGPYAYWMYQVKIPLDIIWMDANRRIVEISANTPPCQTKASLCPTYGGHQNALFVLELGGGEAQRYGLRVGDTLAF